MEDAREGYYRGYNYIAPICRRYKAWSESCSYGEQAGIATELKPFFATSQSIGRTGASSRQGLSR